MINNTHSKNNKSNPMGHEQLDHTMADKMDKKVKLEIIQNLPKRISRKYISQIFKYLIYKD